MVVFESEQAQPCRTILPPELPSFNMPGMARDRLDGRLSSNAFALAEQLPGRKVELPDFFSAPVVIEEAIPESDDILFLRVRTASGTLDEVPVPVDVLADALFWQTPNMIRSG